MIRIRAIKFAAPPPALSPVRNADPPLKIQRAEEHTGAGDHPLGTPRGWGATPEPTGSLIRDADTVARLSVVLAALPSAPRSGTFA
jgi:hypothetical protein